MTTATQTVKEALDAAAADLAEAGLTLVISTRQMTSGDAWCDAVEKHGGRIALIHFEGGWWERGRPHVRDDFRNRAVIPLSRLYVSFPWDDAEAGACIRDTLNAHGLKVEWSGDPTNAVQIHLN